LRGQDYIQRRLTQAPLQRENEGLADFAKGDAFRRSFEGCLEPLDWFAQWFETEPESLMMHRHDELGAGAIRHLDCLLRGAMRPDPGIVRADRHDREIDRAVLTQAGKTVRQCGVPGKKDAPPIALQKIAVVAAIVIALFSGAPVFYSDRGDVNLVGASLKSFPLAPIEFGNIAEPCSP
jgi:hypothetical protein